MSHVRAHFRPEFINRLDEFIVFEPLTHPQIMEIVQLQCAQLASRVAGQRMKLELEPSAIDYLAGAYTRPLFSSTSAVSDTKYTQTPPNPQSHLLHTPYTPPNCTPRSTESAHVEPKSGRV